MFITLWGVLSQYSSYKSLKFLENSLYEHNINSIYLLPISLFDKNIPLFIAFGG